MPATYLRATTFVEAAGLLDDEDTTILAGGQSLLPMMAAGLAAPGRLVDLNHVAGADTIRLDDDAVHIGAVVRHRDLERPADDVAAAAPMLAAASPHVAHAAVRNRGTLVGSICHADPAAEWPAVAVATDAIVQLIDGAGGVREVPATDFLLGPLFTDRADGEVATGVRIPAAPPGTYAAVRELSYRHGDYAVVGVVAQVTLADDAVTDCRLALFGAGGTPLRATEAERVVIESNGRALDEAGRAAQGVADPVTDATASREYRLQMVPVIARRTLEDALAAAGRASAG